MNLNSFSSSRSPCTAWIQIPIQLFLRRSAPTLLHDRSAFVIIDRVAGNLERLAGLTGAGGVTTVRHPTSGKEP
jgi:hypothetical protein